jgi:lysyl-tRNA synthetase class 2
MNSHKGTTVLESRSTDRFAPAASWSVLRLRAELLGRLRDFFAARGFLEVETPLMSAEVIVERHLDPFVTTLAGDPRRPDAGQTLYLQTSPEAAMKRLLAAGGEAIYQVTRSFRNGEQGRLHNPEFTLVEWYRCGDSMAAGMGLLSELCMTLLGAKAAERLSYRAAFLAHVGIDPLVAATADLVAHAHAAALASPPLAETDRDGWLQWLLSELVEPHLGQDAPTILHSYPASQASLARVRDGNPPVAERFELYVDGIELANGYHELTDVVELRARSRTADSERQAEGKPPLPAASRLEAAMAAGLPASAGVALGFDRLVMLAAGANSVAEVMAFPIDRA